MVDEKKTPTVTGISPADGPPGTVVKIRGENLGRDEKDIQAIYICNMNCSFTKEWKSSRLIHARTGMGFGVGDIIVVTFSGGMGNSLVKFRGYMPRVGLLTEAAVWVDESKLFEEKPTTNLSNRRVFSPSSTYTDPLGVAPEETDAMLSADKIEEWYPKTSSSPLSEEFNPSRFLLERHLDTSFDSLKSGYYHLESKDTRKSVGPASFVRGHLATILEALHMLNKVNEMHTINESESIGGNICEELEGVLKSCDYVSHSMFKHILSRKDDADAKRNVLNVLHRYRFLFSLPRSIEKSIQQREYEILISDYNRAKALFQNTEVHSFKKALAEVDQKIAAFSTQLKQKLFDFPTPLEEQKKIIRYLNDLDYPGNAGWECITKQALWIKSMLLDCQVEHQMKDGSNNQLAFPVSFGVLLTESRPTIKVTNKLTFPPTFVSDMQGTEKNPRYKGSPQPNSRSGGDASFNYKKSHHRTKSLPEALQKIHTDAASKKPAGILMVESLCELITENLSDLWNLGQTYLSKQLGDKKDGTKTMNERDEFQEIVKDVIVVFCEMVQAVLQPDELGKLSVEKKKKMDLLIPWLPGAAKSVRTTLERLNKLGLAVDIISPLKTLTMNAIGDCIKKVLTTAVEEISDFHSSELWVLDYSQADYCISQLPGLFEKTFMESVRFAKDYMIDSNIDTKNENRKIHDEVIKLLGEMLEAFLLTLEKTVYNNANTEGVQHADETDSFAKDMQLLILLSNCAHVKSNIIPRVIEQCIKTGFEDIQNLREEIDVAIQKLDERVFASYIEMKGEPLVGEVELGINLAEFRWNAEKSFKGVRRYIQDILMNFTVIHNQVSSVSSLFIERIFTELCMMISEEFLRIFQCIDKFSSNGALQAHLEVNALQVALSLYLDDKARSNMEAALKLIPTLQQSENEKMEALLTTFKNTMRYQLATFSTPSDRIPIDPLIASNRNKKSIDALSTSRRILPTSAEVKALDSRDRAPTKGKLTTSTEVKALNSRDRAPSKGKLKQKKESVGYKIEVEKTIGNKLPVQDGSTLTPVSSEAKPTGVAVKNKTTKRKAPPPPSSLSTTNATARTTSPKSGDSSGSNPFEEDDGNPFLDDDDDDNDEYYGANVAAGDSGNPFLNDEDEKVGGGTGNPFED